MKMKELMDFYRDKRVLVTGHTGRMEAKSRELTYNAHT